MTRSSTRSFIVLGGGAHARVVIGLLLRLDAKILGFTDPTPSLHRIMGVPHLGDDSILKTRDPEKIGLANGLGNVGGSTRRKIYLEQRQHGFSFPPLIHDSAVIDESVEVGNGSQIMAGAVIQPNVQIGENVIVNTNVTVDHDCILGDHVHVAPGTTIAGKVRVGEKSFVGAGSTLIDDLNVGSNATVGAGAVVVHDIPNEVTVVGVPAKPLS